VGLEARIRWEGHLNNLSMEEGGACFEIALRAAAWYWYGSIRKRMKNYFVVGMISSGR